MKDAFEHWRAELESRRPARGTTGRLGPPTRGRRRFGPPAAAPRPHRSLGLSGACQVAVALCGAGLTLLLVLALEFPPPVDPPSPLFLLVPLAGAVAGRIDGPEAWRVALAALLASLAGAATFCIVVPVLGIFELLDCWLSWLADC